MPHDRLLFLAAAALLGLAACQDNKEAPATNEPSEAPVPEAVTPASEVPEVGAMGADATATAVPGDSAAAAAHP